MYSVIIMPHSWAYADNDVVSQLQSTIRVAVKIYYSKYRTSSLSKICSTYTFTHACASRDKTSSAVNNIPRWYVVSTGKQPTEHERRVQSASCIAYDSSMRVEALSSRGTILHRKGSGCLEHCRYVSQFKYWKGVVIKRRTV